MGQRELIDIFATILVALALPVAFLFYGVTLVIGLTGMAAIVFLVVYIAAKDR